MVLHIAAVGDSHTASSVWPKVLEGMICGYGVNAYVCNHGINGGVVVPAIEAVYGGSYMDDFLPEPEIGSKWISVALREILLCAFLDHHDISAVVLQGGANDIGYLTQNCSGTVQRAEEYFLKLKDAELFLEIHGALEKMLSDTSGAGFSPVYINIPPLGKGRLSDECARVVGNLARQHMNERLKVFCSGQRIPYVDAASVLSDGDGWLALAYDGDGLHLNKRGQAKVAEVVFAALKPSLAPFLAAGETGCHST